MVASKDTRKAAALRRSSARSTGRARARVMTPGPLAESGMALGTVVRTAAKVAGRRYKKKEIGNPVTQQYDVRTKAAAKGQAQRRSALNQKIKSNIKAGNIRPLPERGGRYGRLGPNVARMTKAPVKPSARSNSAKYRGRKKK